MYRVGNGIPTVNMMSTILYILPRLINTEHDIEKCADRFMCLL